MGGWGLEFFDGRGVDGLGPFFDVDPMAGFAVGYIAEGYAVFVVDGFVVARVGGFVELAGLAAFKDAGLVETEAEVLGCFARGLEDADAGGGGLSAFEEIEAIGVGGDLVGEGQGWGLREGWKRAGSLKASSARDSQELAKDSGTARTLAG